MTALKVVASAPGARSSHSACRQRWPFAKALAKLLRCTTLGCAGSSASAVDQKAPFSHLTNSHPLDS